MMLCSIDAEVLGCFKCKRKGGLYVTILWWKATGLLSFATHRFHKIMQPFLLHFCECRLFGFVFQTNLKLGFVPTSQLCILVKTSGVAVQFNKTPHCLWDFEFMVTEKY
jgi:hypothetical protein